MSLPLFETIYAGIATEQVKELVDFRNAHPCLAFQSNGLTWRYQRDGNGDRAILFLAGGIQCGEGWFRYMNYYRDRFRVLAVTYPDEVHQLADVMDAIEKLIEIERLSKLAVVGTSLGGMIDQAFIRRCPGPISHLVIANTSHPDPQYSRRLQARLPLVRVVPGSFLRYLTQKRLAQYANPAHHKTKSFFDAYLIEHSLYYTTRAWIVNHYRLIIDFCTHQRFAPTDLASWGGKILLVESEDDLFPESTRQALRALYPQAWVHRFDKGGGHSPAINREAEYKAMLNGFLDA